MSALRRQNDDPEDIWALKAALRVGLRERRRTRADDAADAAALARAVLDLPEVAGAKVVAAYISRPGEPATAVLLKELTGRGVRVLLPVLEPDDDLLWALEDGTRRPGVRPGLLEPAGEPLGREAIGTADVVLVPALGVDGSGARLGQGGGSYDRALTRTRRDALVVALLHDEELLTDPLPVAAHDRLVHAVVTPSRVVRFTTGSASDGGPDPAR